MKSAGEKSKAGEKGIGVLELGGIACNFKQGAQKLPLKAMKAAGPVTLQTERIFQTERVPDKKSLR